MHIEIDDWFGAIVFLVIAGMFIFMIVYAAVRLAVPDTASRPDFSCETSTDGPTTRFTLANIGTAAAFDVAVRSVRDAYGQPFARTVLLAPQATCTWELSSMPAGVRPVEAPRPQQTFDWLSVEWRPKPDGRGRWNRVPVRLAEGVIETDAGLGSVTKSDA
jgi:hypothetical protein